jgi:citronellol/citronellal dehydrogenase
MAGTLKGKTLFISGASRGIGLAIAERAARDGANVAIAAKTTEPHPKLPGTIYSAAEAVEKAGGRALPIVCDIREDAQVEAAVQKTVETFGGIDILVNNASAISLTGTLETPMKRVDLMWQINLRGTYLCSRTCLPYLLKAENPHILTLAPPLNMRAEWFKRHTAYTIAKYGMSMCVLGMAAEFRKDGVAVNALWPRTTIATAALQVIPGAAPEAGRTTDIMANAAHVVLTSPSRSLTGQFLIDEDVLALAGETDFARYAFKPGTPLRTDIFLD